MTDVSDKEFLAELKTMGHRPGERKPHPEEAEIGLEGDGTIVVLSQGVHYVSIPRDEFGTVAVAVNYRSGEVYSCRMTYLCVAEATEGQIGDRLQVDRDGENVHVRRQWFNTAYYQAEDDLVQISRGKLLDFARSIGVKQLDSNLREE